MNFLAFTGPPGLELQARVLSLDTVIYELVMSLGPAIIPRRRWDFFFSSAGRKDRARRIVKVLMATVN